MIGVCAGRFRFRFFLTETVIPCESNKHARSGACIPHMGIQLHTSCRKISRQAAKPQRRKDANGEHQAIERDESSE
jgi:hypothetical protein